MFKYIYINYLLNYLFMYKYDFYILILQLYNKFLLIIKYIYMYYINYYIIN